MLINYQYEGFYGSVGKIGKSSVRTLFFHVLGLPLIPRGAYWVTTSGFFSRDVSVMKIRRSGKSILAGYLRGLAFALALWTVAAGVTFWFMPGQEVFDGDPMPFGRSVIAPLGVIVGLSSALAGLLIWALTRFPVRGDELAKRAIFSQLLGSPVDPAMLDKPWSARDDLKRGMADCAERSGRGPSYDWYDRWHDLALDPSETDPRFLRMALTVTRLAEAAPETGAPKDLKRLHDQIWAKLCHLDPAVRSERPA